MGSIHGYIYIWLYVIQCIKRSNFFKQICDEKDDQKCIELGNNWIKAMETNLANMEANLEEKDKIKHKEDIQNNLKESIWASETHKWTQVSPAVAQLFLSWEIRDKGYKVVFGGEGADEIFASYGDVKRFCWPDPLAWHQKRVNLINNLHKNNLIRTNKAMMYGGKVELRTPFLNKEVIDFGLRIPTRYRDEADGKGNIMKYVLRKAFEGEISDELLWRPKKTFQQGCHTDYLKKEQDTRLSNHKE